MMERSRNDEVSRLKIFDFAEKMCLYYTYKWGVIKYGYIYWKKRRARINK